MVGVSAFDLLKILDAVTEYVRRTQYRENSQSGACFEAWRTYIVTESFVNRCKYAPRGTHSLLLLVLHVV